ncbi:MAG TPA: DNA-processing protein DprA, partial [Rhodothermales bacterium]
MSILHLHPHHPDWPQNLNELHDPPESLYIRGALPTGRAVAVVGTRKMTPYGAYAARMASGTLARLGVAVVSGLAIGIDGVAHAEALKAGGATIAVLGSGVDDAHIYPRLHLSLAQDILRAGYGI